MTFMPAHKATGRAAPGQILNEIGAISSATSATRQELTLKDVINNSLATELTPKPLTLRDSPVRPDVMPPWDVWWHSRPKGFMPKHIEELIKDELDISYD